ncbi:RNase adapter RapZ [Rarobacter incanus]|nr:RNase adapter RapZ [Rarobacter incanus]
MSEPNPMTVPMGIPAVEAAAHRPVPDDTELLIITGMSGAGRTRAAAALEDMQWFVVDNLPPNLLPPLVELAARAGSTVRKIAVVLDVRGKEFFNDLQGVVEQLRQTPINVQMVFLDASDEALVRRFEQVRRPHPLRPEGRLLEGIAAERELLAPIKRRSDSVIDTSNLSVNELARAMRTAVHSEDPGELRIVVMSFGFKHGLPLDADHVADVRFLANPYWITELRHLNGHDAPVRDYVLGQEGAREFVTRYAAALEPVLAGYIREEKRHTTIAIGCTGGQHRSVAIADALSALLREGGHSVQVSARDLGRE